MNGDRVATVSLLNEAELADLMDEIAKFYGSVLMRP
jgi:hypothetical protein